MNRDPNEITDEEALATFYAFCAVMTVVAAIKARKMFKLHKKNKKLKEIHPDVDTAQGILDMKAIHEEWNV